MRADGRRRPRRVARVRRPARGRVTTCAHAVRRRALPDEVPHRPVPRVGRAAATRRPWFAHVSFLRPHPPFLAPAPYDTMFDPASVPTPVRARDPGRRRRAAPAARRDDRPSVPEVARRRPGAARAAGDLLRHAGRGRRPARRACSTGSTRPGQADRTLVIFTSDHGENLGDHYMLHKLGLVRRVVPRAADRARSRASTAGARSTRSPSTSTCCRRSASCSAPTCRCSATGARSRRGCAATTPDDWRDEAHFEFDFRDPDSALLEEAFGLTLEECALAVLRDEHGKYVQFSGYPGAAVDLLRPRRRSRADPQRRRRSRVRGHGARLRATHAGVAHAAHRTHAHRHEADDARGPRRAQRAPPVNESLMDARTFFGLEPRRRPTATRWRMEVVRGLTSGTGALFGGCGLGACIEVMEEITGRPCIWATAQYLSFARPAGGARARRAGGRPRPPDLAGARDRTRRRHRDPHRARRARVAARCRSKGSGRCGPTSPARTTARRGR